MHIKRHILVFLRKFFSDKTYIRIRYFKTFNSFPNLKKPGTFNEKINWLKLYYKNAELSKFVDKYNVRDYVKKQVGVDFLNEIYGIYNTVEDINWKKLPDQFVLKATHGSGWVIICKNKKELDIEATMQVLNSWLNQNYYDLWGEKIYKHLKPRIICEKYLQNSEEDGLNDYKFYCFNGEPHFLHIDVARFNKRHYINFYDLEWNKLPIKKGFSNSIQFDKRPDKLNEMIETARKLSTSLPFVRVDLYEVEGKVYFGELTFYPQNGFSSFYPKKYERDYGKLIDLKNIKHYKSPFYKNPSFSIIYRLRYYFSRFTSFEKLVISLKKRRGDFQDPEFTKYLNSADEVNLPDHSEYKIPNVGLVKDLCNYGELVQKRSHWPKYERFLIKNNIPYSFYNIHDSNWLEKAIDYDLILFRPDNSPAKLHDAKSKIYFLEYYLNIKCFPSNNEIWAYEDKIRANYIYKQFNIPHVKTFITHNKIEAYEYIDKTEYPLVSKISCGSVSRGVILLKNKKQAKKMVRKVFSYGKSTYWPEYKQKNYVYLQKFVEDAIYDLRIIVVGDKVSGYYRMSIGNDFRASGSGIWQYNVTELPEEAMKIAVKLKKAIGSTILAVDLIKSEHSNQFLVIESSVFYDVDSYEELIINKVVGYYEWNKKDGELFFTFKPGKYWIQELVANELIKQFQTHKKQKQID